MSKQRSLLLFEQAIKSKATLKNYKYHLENFMKWAKIKNYDGLLQAPQKNIQILLEDYVIYLKSKISSNSVSCYFSPIELFYVMNDVTINYRKIRKLFPEKTKKGNGRAYTLQEIQKMLSHARTLRNKTLVSLLASSGCRIGAIPDIRLRHLTKIESSYCILIYEDDKEEDYIFTTPETSKIINEYLDQRKKDGEYMDDESPLFRTMYRLGIEKVKPCTIDALTHTIDRLVLVIDRKKVGKTRRFDVAKNHEFRKFFATAIKDVNDISPTMTEKLINHVGVTQLDGSYYKPTKEKMFEAYKKCIDVLTIDDSNHNKIKIQKLEDEKIKSEETEIKLRDMDEKLKKYEKDTEFLFKILDKIDIDK
jgi:integrase/recombinase XerD